MIEVCNLNYHYPHKPNTYENFSFSLHQGALYGLFGKNGEGKTTLLKLLAGLLLPQSGQIRIDGLDALQREASYMAKIFYLSEEPSFDLHHTPSKTYTAARLAASYAPLYANFSAEEYQQFLTAFEIDKTERLLSMSYGQKKKVLIALALAINTPILYLDEPTNGLDIPSKAVFRNLLHKRLDNRYLTIISTHQAHDLEQVVNGFIMLNNKKILTSTNLEQFHQNFHIEYAPANLATALYSEQQLNEYKCLVRGPATDVKNQADLEFIFNAFLFNNLLFNGQDHEALGVNRGRAEEQRL